MSEMAILVQSVSIDTAPTAFSEGIAPPDRMVEGHTYPIEWVQSCKGPAVSE